MKEAVNQGISKFNIATEYFREINKAMEAHINERKAEDVYSLMNSLDEPVTDFLRKKIRLINPNKFSL